MSLAGAATVATALLLLFVWLFDPLQLRWGVDALWLAALLVWVVAVWRQRDSDVRRARHGAPLLPRLAPLLVFLAVFAAAWLPFATNWRWAFTGDSLAWFEVPYNAGRDGPHQSLLSVRGVDDNFTYLHSIGPHVLMMLVEPTMFWHRAGKLLLTLAGLASIWWFFALTVGRAWALAIVVAVATNYVFIWYSFVSYGHIASYALAYASLALAALLWQRPDDPVRWMACGLVAGLALYFTQTAWAEVAAVGAVLSVAALRTRRIDRLAIYGFTAVIVALPFALQWQDVAAMFARNAGVEESARADYLQRIFVEILSLPVMLEQCELGACGAFLRPPLGWSYVAGAVLAGLGASPAVRWRLRLPAVAPVVLGLLLADAVLMTLTNNAYANISTKRAYHLIPYFVFLALLPLIVVGRFARGWAARGVAVGTAVVLLVYAAGNARLVFWPPRGMYGFTVFDALIELRQRFPEQRIALFTSRTPEFEYAVQGPESPVAREYRIGDALLLERRIDPAGLADACAADALLCYEPEFDEEAFNIMVAPIGAQLQRFDFYNSVDLRCFRCP